VDREKSRVIEISGHNDLPSCTCDGQDLGVSGAFQADARGVDGLMTGVDQPVCGSRRDRHVDEEVQPSTSSTLSSSARLAA
jgi:hypothetical protein